MKNWEIIEFEKCLDKVPTSSKVPKKKFLESGKYPIVSQEEQFINGYWDNDIDVLKVEKPVIVWGDHTKVVKLVDFDFVKGADGVKVFLPKQSIDSAFFAYQLRSVKLKELGYARHYRLLKKEKFVIPPLEEQKQIVSILDEAFEKIEQAKANIEKSIQSAKELFQSKLNEIFAQKGNGWEKKTLGDVCEKTKNINWKDYTNEEFEYIDLSSVSRDTLLVTETTMVNKENAPSRAKRIIQKGDVIFATTRPTLKRATIITSDLDGQICSTGFVVLRPKKNINSDWIFFYLLTSTFMDRMESLQRGASYPAVTDSDVKDSTLSIPLTKELEDSIVTKMNNLRRSSNELVLQYLQKLSDLDELKKSILQKAFAGELTNKTVEA